MFPILLVVVSLLCVTTVSAQSNSFIKCDLYSVSNTDSANQNYQLCQIDNVCPGVKLYISDCSSTCSGDQYIRLFDASNSNQLAGNDDGACESPLNLCSSLEYSYTNVAAGCVSMVLRQGCYDTGSCSGRVKVNYVYTSAPTYAPSAFPTAAPTTAKPTSQPTAAVVLGVNDVSCAPYTAFNTNKANTRYAVCNFQLCPGTVLTVGDCADSCSGDQFIRLFDGSDNLVMYDDDGCDASPYSLCSQLIYVYSSGVCQTFSLHQGCYGDESCGGTMSITKIATSAPSVLPTALPSSKPSAEPSLRPTAIPSALPTAKPSAEPTSRPTAVPTSIPTAKPSAEPTTATPTSLPTFAPTLSPYTGFATTDITELTTVFQNVWYRSKYPGVIYTVYDCAFNYADDASCQARYPGAQILTADNGDGQPVKFAVLKDRRVPTATPTVTPTAPASWKYFNSYYVDSLSFSETTQNKNNDYSCAEACAFIFGSTSDKYRCSISSTGMTDTAYYNKWGGQYCNLVPDGTKNCATYTASGCLSAYVLGPPYPYSCHNLNYCWKYY